MTTDTGNRNVILLSHGGGGTRTQQLVDGIIRKHLGNALLDQMDDSAELLIPEADIAFTTDSFVVKPIFFPGGDIGRLAACGTINDLAMQGAEPRYLSLGLILEEGFPIADLERVLESLAEACREAGTSVVTGDTKVVERGLGTGIAINTSGLGVRLPGTSVRVSNARPGDVVIVTGTIGDHGVAVMTRREGLKLDSEIRSDVAPLWIMVKSLLNAVPGVRCLRDPTRGGIAGALCDIAKRSRVSIEIEQADIPVRSDVSAACRVLGLDVLNVANEGKAVVVCAEADARMALAVLKANPYGKDSAIIGRVVTEPEGVVLLNTAIGGKRIVQLPSGEDLPRIC